MITFHWIFFWCLYLCCNWGWCSRWHWSWRVKYEIFDCEESTPGFQFARWHICGGQEQLFVVCREPQTGPSMECPARLWLKFAVWLGRLLRWPQGRQIFFPARGIFSSKWWGQVSRRSSDWGMKRFVAVIILVFHRSLDMDRRRKLEQRSTIGGALKTLIDVSLSMLQLLWSAVATSPQSAILVDFQTVFIFREMDVGSCSKRWLNYVANS